MKKVIETMVKRELQAYGYGEEIIVKMDWGKDGDWDLLRVYMQIGDSHKPVLVVACDQFGGQVEMFFEDLQRALDSFQHVVKELERIP